MSNDQIIDLRSRLRSSLTERAGNIPSDLKAIPAFLNWRVTKVDPKTGKFNKIPVYATNGKNRQGEQGSPDDLANLVPFDEAMKALKRDKTIAGVGMALLEPFALTALDVDGCVVDGETPSHILSLVDTTYAEISPSGKGIRAFYLGQSKDGKNHDDGFELFSSKGFVTITGNQVGNAYSGLGMVLQTLTPSLRDKLETLARSKGKKDAGETKKVDPIVKAFKKAGLYERPMQAGKHSVTCPFESGHSDPDRAPGDGDTVILEAHFNGHDATVIQCSHASCAGYSQRDFLEAIGVDSMADVFDDISDKVDRFKPQQIAAFAVETYVEWLVRNVVPRQGLGLIYGSSTAGKTFWALDILFAISRGLSHWREFHVTPGSVLYIAAEAANGVRKRMRAYAMHHNIPLDDIPFRIISNAPNLMQGDHKALSEAIGAADVVVVDTLAAVMPGADENGGKDVGLVLARCKHIQEVTGALVILIHHSGKNESAGARGWSGIRAAVDVEICINRNNDNRIAEITKLKDGSGEGRKFPFRLQVVDLGLDAYGEQDTSCVVEQLDCVPGYAIKEPSGVIQRIVHKIVKSSGPIHVDDVLSLAAEQIVHDPQSKRDRRRDQARTALNALVDGKFLWHVDGKVALYGQGLPLEGGDDGMS